MVCVIDNYDSFTYNLVQYLGELGAAVRVVRNDAASVGDVDALRPERIVISPGPGRPEDAGITMAVIRELGRKTSTIEHDSRGVFSGIAEPFVASRYHSLVVSDAGLPADLEVTARTRDDKVIMGLRHRQWPVHGVQFHPESILTGEGHRILRNFLEGRA